MTSIEDAQPIVKWAGGKRQLEGVILKHAYRIHPGEITDYYEPFAGGLAIFFALAREKRIKRAVLSDTNADLINLYQVVKKDPRPLTRDLKKLADETGFSEAAYYEVRACRPESPAARAARFLYLNKVGYNGLYRVNAKGDFNVPYGHPKKPPKILHEDALRAAHLALQCAELAVASYDSVQIQDGRNRSPFAYFDPPYWPTKPTSSFTSYTAGGFCEVDQVRLANEFEGVTARGISALLSNSHVPGTRRLYAPFVSRVVEATRRVNSVGTGRGKVQEILVESRLKKRKATGK